MELTVSSNFGNPEFNQLIREIVNDKEIQTELKNHAWLKSTLRKWIHEMQGKSEATGYHLPVKRMSTESRQLLMDLLKAELFYEIQKKYTKHAELKVEKAWLTLNEQLDLVEEHDLENDKVVQGGMFTGQLDTASYLPLIRELVDYSLTMAGFQDKVISMDTIAEYVHTSCVSDYIQELQLCLEVNQSTTLQDLQNAIKSSENAVKIANDKSKPRPVIYFAEMISILNKKERC